MTLHAFGSMTMQRLLPITAIMIVWQIIAWLQIAPLVIASPFSVLTACLQMSMTGALVIDAGLTLYRTLCGCLIASIVGIPLGLAMGFSDRIYSALEFPVEFFRSIPATALLPVFMLLFGIGELSKIMLSGYAAGLTLALNSMYGVHVGKDLRRRAAKTLGIKGYALFRKIVFPEALPHVISGLRISLSLSLVVIIVAEMFVGSSAGLGKRIIEAQQIYRIDEMYGTILISGIIGYTLNRLALAVERRLLHWRGK